MMMTLICYQIIKLDHLLERSSQLLVMRTKIIDKPVMSNFISENRSELLLLPSEEYKNLLPRNKQNYFYKLSIIKQIYPFSVLSDILLKFFSKVNRKCNSRIPLSTHTQAMK